MAKKIKKKTRKNYRSVHSGRIYINTTFNNTVVTITDESGNALCWSSTGESGFSGSRKSTPFAATVTIENALNKAKNFGLSEFSVFVKGAGPGREVIVNILKTQKFKVKMLADLTPIPHNGSRPRKAKHNH